MQQTDTFFIQQVAMMTGLSKQVIRKWENRHQIVTPLRLQNGYRQYTIADIQTLMHVKKLTEEGYSLQQCAQIVQSSKQQMPPKSGQANEYVLRILEFGTLCDEDNMTIYLHKAYNEHGLDHFLREVVIPLMQEVGNRWETNKWDEYQEALTSLTVRDFLVQIRRSFKVHPSAPLVLGACLPSEQHEIPILIVLLQMMMKGYRTAMIGASPAVGAIESLTKQLRPSFVFLSATTSFPFEEHPHVLQKLELFAANQRATTFFIGGAGIKKKQVLYLQSIKHLPSVEDYPFSNIALTT